MTREELRNVEVGDIFQMSPARSRDNHGVEVTAPVLVRVFDRHHLNNVDYNEIRVQFLTNASESVRHYGDYVVGSDETIYVDSRNLTKI